MKSELVKTDKFNFVLFEDIFNDQELNQIWQEVNFLCYKNKLLTEEETGSAYKDEKLLKKNSGIWLDEIYQNRNISNYLNLYKTPFSIPEMNQYVAEDYTLNLFKNTDADQTLLSYYEDQGYYGPHYDISCYTYVFWLFKEPKNFTGGDFYFEDVDCKINVRSNIGVLFPSWARHFVDEINMINNAELGGRVAFTTFFKFKN